jgi:hypothetical protein
MTWVALVGLSASACANPVSIVQYVNLNLAPSHPTREKFAQEAKLENVNRTNPIGS